MRIYIYVYIYIYMCVYICVYIYIYVCICIHIYIYKHMYVCMYVCMIIYIYVQTSGCCAQDLPVPCIQRCWDPRFEAIDISRIEACIARSSSPLSPKRPDRAVHSMGASIIRIGFGGYIVLYYIHNDQDPHNSTHR